jgi:HTH-type transcriptional regulator/antitoxin HigA
MSIKPIKTESDYKEALSRIEALWDAEPNTKKGDELSILAVLVESYEAEKFRILPPDPVEAIKFRMDQSGMKKAELATFLGGRNRSSEILSRKRPLSVRMMRILHHKMKIPAASLLAETMPAKRGRKAG